MRTFFIFLTATTMLNVAADDTCLECDLYVAIRRRDRSTVNRLIEKGADVESWVEVQYDEEVGELTVRPVPPATPLSAFPALDVWNPIKAAITEGDLDIIRMLLDEEIDPGDGLSVAAGKGRTEIVSTLLKTLPPSEKRIEALFSAVRGSRRHNTLPSVRLILDSGIDINVAQNDQTLLRVARETGSGDMADLLRDRGGEMEPAKMSDQGSKDIETFFKGDTPDSDSESSASLISQDSTPEDRENTADEEAGGTSSTQTEVPQKPLTPDDLAPLLGTWVNPYALGVPETAAKDVWDANSAGALFTEIEDEKPVDRFSYRIISYDLERKRFQVVVAYGPEKVYHGLVQVSKDGQVREFESYGPNIDVFPDKFTPASPFYVRTYRPVESQQNKKLIGTWIDPKEANLRGRIGKIVYRTDGTGGIYDLASDRNPVDTFTFRILWVFPDTVTYHVIQEYAPDVFWYLLIKLSQDGDILQMDAYRQNEQRYPAQINPYDGFFWKGYRG